LASAKAPSSSAKAVRNPVKSALLARMAAPTGRGRGFAVHKAPDKVGVRRSAAADGCGRRHGVLWSGLALLAVPGALTGRVEAQRRQPREGQSAPVAGAKPAASCP
jgi:hypothetical protein